MSDTRQYYSTRTLVDVDDFLGLDGTEYLFCLSGPMLYALRKMAKTRLLWPTTYAAAKYEQHYVLPSASQWDQIEDIVSAFIADSEVVEMCNTALIEALRGVSDAIKLSSCCYEAGSGGQFIGEDFYYGTETPLSEPTSFGPGEEFETEAEWQDHKCEVANGIIDALIGTCNGLSVLSLVSLTSAGIIAGMVGIGLVFVPPVAILVALLATGFLLGTLTSLATAMSDNKSALVCALYTSTTAQSAYDNLNNAVQDLAIDIGVLELEVGALSNLIMTMAPIDTMNKLYKSVGLPEIAGVPVSCEAQCVDCPSHTVIYGTYNQYTGRGISSFEDGFDPDRHTLVIRLNWDPETEIYCGGTQTVGITEVSGTPYSITGDIGYRLQDQDGVNVYNSKDTPPASPVSGVAFIMLLNNQDPPQPFEVDITIS